MNILFTDPYSAVAAIELLEKPDEWDHLRRILNAPDSEAEDALFNASEYCIDVIGRRRIEEVAARFREGELEMPAPLRRENSDGG